MFLNGFEFSVLVRGKSIREYVHNGKTYIEGRNESGYQLKLVNNTSTDAEVVFSVDGLDTCDGEAASVKKSGYVVPAYRSVIIDGWRLNDREVAAFEFGSTKSSYAAGKGKPRNVGVIGAAVFSRKPQFYWDWNRQAQWNPNVIGQSVLRSHASNSWTLEESTTQISCSTGSEGSKKSRPGGSSMKSAGLGTKFGEKQESAVQHVDFVRASDQPNTIFELHYNDRQGLEELGIPVAQPLSDDTARRETARAFEDVGCKPPEGWKG